MTLARRAEAALDVLLPPLCLHCSTPLGRARPALCPECLAGIAPLPAERCLRCGLPRPGSPAECGRCRTWPPGLTALAATAYGGPVRSLVQTLKYRGWRHLAETCAGPMERALAAREITPDAFVPVPLHPARRRSRGFNQAALLAAALAGRRGRPALDALVRDRATRPQVGSSRAERAANVRGAFRAVLRFAPHETVALIDDVATSGATLTAAAEALTAGGAGKVVGVTFALAPDTGAG